MRLVLSVPVIFAGMIGAALAVAGSPVVAADCLAEPNRDTPAGQHWYFHLDRGGDRKCWYLHATVPAGAAEAPAMELQSVHRRQAAPAAEPQRRPVATPAAELPRRQVAAPQSPAPQRPLARSEADEAALYLEFLRWKEQHHGEP